MPLFIRLAIRPSGCAADGRCGASALQGLLGGAGLGVQFRNQTLAFSFGVVAVHWLPGLQPLWPCLLALGLGCLLPSRLRVAAMALIGLGWGAHHASTIIQQRVHASCAEAHLSGRIVDLPTRQRLASGIGTQRFLLAPEQASCPLPERVLLNWFDGERVRAGELWRLHVRLKPPRGAANRHGVDRDRWYTRSGIAAQGYVVAGDRIDGARRSRSPPALLAVLRERVRDRLGELPLVNGAIVAALTLGDASAIANSQMELYRRTGTLHLLVISGLHVGIVTAVGFLLGRGIGLLTGVAPKALGSAVALLLAGGYVLLAGAGLSLVRAFTMSATAMLALVAGRSTLPSAVFAYALAAVLVLDPMAPLATGFWLSFGAVAVLLAFFAPRSRQRGASSWVRSALLAQLAIFAIFAPASAVLTGLVHPLGVFVNLVVVPLTTMAVVPLALAGVALLGTVVGPWLLLGADFCIAIVGQVLAVADRMPPLYVVPPGWWLAWLLGAAAALLLPLSKLAVLAVAAGIAALLIAPPLLPSSRLASGEMSVAVLDVGQGTAVVVETARHVLVYDTGPAYPTGTDSGMKVVLPELRARGIDAVDVLVLSHGDLDHVGGAASVLAGVDVGRVMAGEATPGIVAEPCRAGVRWRWDGVRFSLLGPDRRREGNNASCILLIESSSARVLLAGDIEEPVERALAVPPVDVLLVPHHGSATSSTTEFVAMLQPRFAIVSAGWNNRFGHPHPAVLERYRDSGAHVVSTAVSGALRWRSDRADEVVAERCRSSPYWRLGTPAEARLLLPCR